MTFLLLPYILSSYLSSSIPLAWEQDATQAILAYATVVPVSTTSTIIVPTIFPDLADAFLASDSDQLVALNQDIEDLPLNPLAMLTPTPQDAPIPEITALPLVVNNDGPGISVLPPLPIKTPAAQVKTAPVSVPVVVPTPLPTPKSVAPKPVIVASPVVTATPMYIPPRPTPVPISTGTFVAPPTVVPTPYRPAVLPPPVVSTPMPRPTASYVPVAPTVVAPPTSATTLLAPSVANAVRGPIMKAVQSDNLPTYYITIPRLGVSNVPVNPTDASSDDIWKATLIKGVGQLLYPPDSGHKTVIFGHSSNYKYVKSNYNEVFKNLSQMKVGDNISVDFKGKRINYIVKKTEVVPATTASIVTDYGREELILFTCWPYLTSRERYIVYLDRI